MTFGADGTKARLVYQASSANEAIAKPSLLAAEHQGAELINWASHRDRMRFLHEITALAQPLEPTRRSKNETVINASTQSKFSLN
jgi:hypothetical protein